MCSFGGRECTRISAMKPEANLCKEKQGQKTHHCSLFPQTCLTLFCCQPKHS